MLSVLQLPAYSGFDLISQKPLHSRLPRGAGNEKEGKEIAALYCVSGTYPPFSRDVAPSDFYFCGRLTVYFDVQRL